MTTDPRTVTRFVLVTASSSAAVDSLVAPYGPTLVCGIYEAHRKFERLAPTDGGWSRLADGDLPTLAEALAAQHRGATIALVADAGKLGALLCHALGVPAEAADRLLVLDDAVSVLEVDAQLRWAVVRLNEGRPLPGDRLQGDDHTRADGSVSD